MVSCRGKTVLVTNASRVPGGVAAMALADAGARVLVHDDRSTARVEAIVKKIRSSGGVAKAITADISTADGPRELAQQTREIVGDRLDILIFNPSLPKAQAIDDAIVEAFDARFAASARAPFFLVQLLLPILNRGSSIIFTCTPAESEATDALPDYLSTKDAILNLTRHFAALLKPRGIRVNAIEVRGPGAPGRRRGASSGPAVARYVGETIAFLASSEAEHLTGETYAAATNRS